MSLQSWFSRLSLFFAMAFLSSGQTYTISTFAGTRVPTNVPATSTALYPTLNYLAVDSAGNVYFSDAGMVLRLDAKTNFLTIVAGAGKNVSGDGQDAGLSYPRGVAIDSSGNLFIADTSDHRIRKVANGIITTIAGTGRAGFSGDAGPASAAQLNSPINVAVDSEGTVYIADTGNQRIRRVHNGVITTIAGNGVPGLSGDNGPAVNSQLNYPESLAIDLNGNMYIADLGNNRVREISSGIITTFAGNGTQGFSGDAGLATNAQLNQPSGVAVNLSGTELYIADPKNSRIRRVANGIITTAIGNGAESYFSPGGPDDGLATSITLNVACATYLGVALDLSGNIFLPDVCSSRIRKVTNGIITTVAGHNAIPVSGDGGSPANAQLFLPCGVAADASGSLYIVEYGSGYIRKVSNGVITTILNSLSNPLTAAVDPDGNLYFTQVAVNGVFKLASGKVTTIPGVNSANGIAVDTSGNLYFCQRSRVLKMSKDGIITTVAGTGVEGFSGDNGPAISAQISAASVAVDKEGTIYLYDSARVRKIASGVIATIAGNGIDGDAGDFGSALSAQVSRTGALAVDSTGRVYLFDGSKLRRIANGEITTIAGGQTSGFSGDDGPATDARFNADPGGARFSGQISIDKSGTIYVADTYNNRIRALVPGNLPVIRPNGIVPLYSAMQTVQPGSWASIYGDNFANASCSWNLDFPTSLCGVNVTFGGKAAYLWSVSPTQINLQIPDGFSERTVSVEVVGPNGNARGTAVLSPYSPSFSLFGDGKHAAGVILTPNGNGAYGSGSYDLLGPPNAFAFNARPAKAGETLVLYGVGFGPTTPAVPAGVAFVSAAPTTMPVYIGIGGANAEVKFAGLTAAGLYQFNVIVPKVGFGDQPLTASINGFQPSQSAYIAIQ